MVSEVKFSSDIDRLDFVDGSKTFIAKNPTLTMIAQQAISLFASVDPARVKNVGEYVIQQIENIQFADQFYVAYSANDFEAVKGIIEKMAAADASALRNLMLEGIFSEMADQGNIEMMQFMMAVCPEFAKLDADTVHYAIEECIMREDEDSALWLLENLAEGVDFSDAAEDLLDWELQGLEEEMPRLTAALQAMIDAR